MRLRQYSERPSGPPNSDNVELIKSFIDIAKKTGQSSKVMDFPPIDHDNPIK